MICSRVKRKKHQSSKIKTTRDVWLLRATEKYSKTINKRFIVWVRGLLTMHIYFKLFEQRKNKAIKIEREAHKNNRDLNFQYIFRSMLLLVFFALFFAFDSWSRVYVIAMAMTSHVVRRSIYQSDQSNFFFVHRVHLSGPVFRYYYHIWYNSCAEFDSHCAIVRRKKFPLEFVFILKPNSAHICKVAR